MGIVIISLLGGVALFLFGMSLMGEGLKKAAGNKLELTLWKLTNNPIKGVLLGTVVTAIIQSSSATTVIVVGLVNSGMMKVIQSISVIMGANIGTSITGWILCLSYIGGDSAISSLLSTATISAVVAIIGILFRSFSKSDTKKQVGDILLGFAVLMCGLQTMSTAVAPLRESAVFTDILTSFSNPFLGILIGIIVTAILQSSSAAVGLLQALTVTGVIDFSLAFPIIMGMGIGAAAPVLLSSLSANTNGKRTAFVYLFNDLFGAVLISVIFYTANAIFHFSFLHRIMSPVSIAFLNSVFRIATVILLFPFIKYVEKLVTFLFKDKPEELEDRAEIEKLEERFIVNPTLAIERSKQVLGFMAEKTRKNLTRSIRLLTEYEQEGFDKVLQQEDVIDQYEDKLGSYLVKVTSAEVSDAQSRELSLMLHAIGDLERIGDHAVNIVEAAKEINDKKIEFSGEAKIELEVLSNAIQEIVSLAIDTFNNEDVELAKRVEPLEELVDILCDELKLRHVNRLQAGTCTLNQGFIFNDLITNYERVSDHCSNLAVAVVELETKMGNSHEYMNRVKDAQFNHFFEEYKKKYAI